MAREERADSILGDMDEFIANIDHALEVHERGSTPPALGRLIGRLELSVDEDRDEHSPSGWRDRLGRIEQLARLPTRR